LFFERETGQGRAFFFFKGKELYPAVKRTVPVGPGARGAIGPGDRPRHLRHRVAGLQGTVPVGVRGMAAPGNPDPVVPISAAPLTPDRARDAMAPVSQIKYTGEGEK